MGLPLLLSCLAGGSTCLGAAVVFCCQTVTPSQLAFALSLAGSVMMTVSFYSILPECFRIDDELKDQGDTSSLSSSSSAYLSIYSILFWQRCFGFGMGGLSYFCLAKCAFPEPNELIFASEDDDEENPLSNNQHETELITSTPLNLTIDDEKEQLLQQRITPKVPAQSQSTTSPTVYDKQYKPLLSSSFWHGTDLANAHAKRAWRVALLLFVSLLVHNFPEGLAVAASTLHSPHLGITTTIAIALHNIPEGIAVAVPCLAARPNAPWMAFALASASGLAEPVGALVALWLLPQNNNDNSNNNWMKNILAYVAGIMIVVAVRELFPEAWKNVRHQKRKTSLIWGSMMGVLIMVGSEAVLE